MAAGASCQKRLKTLERRLLKAMGGADRRGYTGYVRSRGGLFDDPRVKKIMKRIEVLQRICHGPPPGGRR